MALLRFMVTGANGQNTRNVQDHVVLVFDIEKDNVIVLGNEGEIDNNKKEILSNYLEVFHGNRIAYILSCMLKSNLCHLLSPKNGGKNCLGSNIGYSKVCNLKVSVKKYFYLH